MWGCGLGCMGLQPRCMWGCGLDAWGCSLGCVGLQPGPHRVAGEVAGEVAGPHRRRAPRVRRLRQLRSPAVRSSEGSSERSSEGSSEETEKIRNLGPGPVSSASCPVPQATLWAPLTSLGSGQQGGSSGVRVRGVRTTPSQQCPYSSAPTSLQQCPYIPIAVPLQQCPYSSAPTSL